MKPGTTKTRWTVEQETELKRLHKKGATLKEIADAIKRPLGSIGNKIVALGLSSRTKGKQHRQPGLNNQNVLPTVRIATGIVTHPRPGVTVHTRLWKTK